jgi:hypothetical protein
MPSWEDGMEARLAQHYEETRDDRKPEEAQDCCALASIDGAGHTIDCRYHDEATCPTCLKVEVVCASCHSYLARTTRLGAQVCLGCAHNIDHHGARLFDAFAADPCEEEQGGPG